MSKATAKTEPIEFDFPYEFPLFEIKEGRVASKKVPVTVAGDAFEYTDPEAPSQLRYYGRITHILYGPESTNIIDVVKALGGLDILQEAADCRAECEHLQRRIAALRPQQSQEQHVHPLRITIVGKTTFPGVLLAEEAEGIVSGVRAGLNQLINRASRTNSKCA